MLASAIANTNLNYRVEWVIPTDGTLCDRQEQSSYRRAYGKARSNILVCLEATDK